MHERGVHSVAVIYNENGVLDFDHDIDAFFGPNFFEELPSSQLIPEALGEGLFVAMLNQGGYIQARGYSRTHGELATHFGQSSWSGMTYEASAGEALVKDLGRPGHDTVLLVKELDVSEYRFGKKTIKGAKGILSGETGVTVYASFQAALIDTGSGELRPLGTYIQASLKEVLGLVGKPRFQAFSTDEREQIAESLKALIENNVRQTLLVFKMIPIRGREFMTLEDLPESETVGLEYPE